MNLYLISQTKNGECDTFDSAVVVAETEQDAREAHPKRGVYKKYGKWRSMYNKCCLYSDAIWVQFDEIECVDVKFLGTTSLEKGVILASFNAG